MSTECMEKANRHFLLRTKKVYIEMCSKIESFEEYLNEKCAYKIKDGLW